MTVLLQLPDLHSCRLWVPPSKFLSFSLSLSEKKRKKKKLLIILSVCVYIYIKFMNSKQALGYNPQQVQHSQYYHHQLYGTSSSTMPTPYFYGYSVQAPRGTFSTPQAHRMPGPSYIYYPTQMEAAAVTSSLITTTYTPPHPSASTTRHNIPSFPSPTATGTYFLSYLSFSF